MGPFSIYNAENIGESAEAPATTAGAETAEAPATTAGAETAEAPATTAGG
jgi:hypothetical protein